MQMKLLLIFLFAIPATAQVQVSQSFLDDANRAFVEVQANRKVIAAQDAEIKAKDDLISALSALNKQKDFTITAQDEQIKRVLAIKCNETRFFFGIVKTKRCF
jgi:transcription elongation factor